MPDPTHPTEPIDPSNTPQPGADTPSPRAIPAPDEPPLTIAEAMRQLRSGALTAVALTQRCLDRIAQVDGDLQACVTVVGERALAQAEGADATFAAARERDAHVGGGGRGRAAGGQGAALARLSPLLGIPLGIKDLIETEGIRTTAGSRVLADWVPDADAAVVRALTAAGATTLAKTNTHEFAYGTYTQPTRNPWDVARVPGGSSGGSAAGVAAAMFPGALGSDTGGSIRIPAACCGVTGLKPTYGLVSRAGVIPLSWSLDHVGPIAHTVEDCALLLDALAGYDPADPDSVEVPLLDYTAALADNRDPADAVRGLRLAIPTNEFFDAADADVLAAWQAALAILTGLGAEVREITFPGSLDDLFGVYRAIQRPEAYVFHSEMGWLETRADLYSPAVRANLEAGAHITASEYIQAQRHRRAFTDDLRATLADVDALLTPTQPLPPPRIDALDTPVSFHGRDETPGYLMLRNTFAFDLTGQPALALPCGFTRDGLPVSLQIVAAQRFGEPTVLRLGHAYQRVTDWHERIP